MRQQSQRLLFVLLLILFSVPLNITAAENVSTSHQSGASSQHKHRPSTRSKWTLPSRQKIWRVISLQDYNTRVVLFGTFLLGLCAGIVGVFMLLRRRSLMGDVVGHASLPGIAIAFIVMESISPGHGKTLFGLLIGAAIAGLLGVVVVSIIVRWTRIKEDAALAIVLSVFFGLGAALLTIIQKMPFGSSAGLQSFILGKAASLVADDVKLIAIVSGVVLLVAMLLFKEFRALCFDEEYAATQGLPVFFLDLILMSLVVAVTVIGLQSVGLLLVVALLIIPAASSRFWSDELGQMTFISACIGGASALLGSLPSALLPYLGTGSTIILMGSFFFLLSLLFGTRRGVLQRFRKHLKSKRRVGRHDLLRACYELLEAITLQEVDSVITINQLVAKRSWKESRVRKLLYQAEKEELLIQHPHGDKFQLTEQGLTEARRIARNHRMWELFLIRHADIAPGHVDRDADEIEHVLDLDIIEELQKELEKDFPQMLIPQSPHTISTS
ncbi:Manganese ABC transporter, inner membrane permease protein SitC [hydrothermal vent metagenome]|uniref:Manganese ABC transporter, inner membrane permease protein SitC n=1 Tax=hydrothermal vent metagenome TaxID=652676 RepID=A0A3B1E6W4_9ZZZZ